MYYQRQGKGKETFQLIFFPPLRSPLPDCSLFQFCTVWLRFSPIDNAYGLGFGYPFSSRPLPLCSQWSRNIEGIPSSLSFPFSSSFCFLHLLSQGNVSIETSFLTHGFMSVPLIIPRRPNLDRHTHVFIPRTSFY